MTRHLIIVTVPFQMSFMQFHELHLVVLTKSWSTSFPHTCKSSSLINLSKRLSRNGPKKLILSLQGCFDCTDWAMFSESCANQDEYADTVTAYVSFCIDSCIPSKTVTIYANDKSWFSKDTKHKLIAKNYAFKNSD